jgi:hypothetical protein
MLRRSLFLRKTKLPGRKCLDDVVKLELFNQAPPETIMNIWLDHHKQFVQYYGRVISTAAYNAMRPRLEKSRYFVVPIFRDKGLFNVVTNWNEDIVGVVPLGEFQKLGDHATVHMTIQFFTELSQSKNLVLVRCEIQDQVMMRQDCVFLTSMLLRYYTMPHLYENWVETFNKRPNQFDYHAYLRNMKDEAQKDTVNILDKKNELRTNAYSTDNILKSKGLSATSAGISTIGTGSSTSPEISIPTGTQKEALFKAHTRAQNKDK